MVTSVETITETFMPVPRSGVGNTSTHCTHMINHPTLLAILEKIVRMTTAVPMSSSETMKMHKRNGIVEMTMQAVWIQRRPNYANHFISSSILHSCRGKPRGNLETRNH